MDKRHQTASAMEQFYLLEKFPLFFTNKTKFNIIGIPLKLSQKFVAMRSSS